MFNLEVIFHLCPLLVKDCTIWQRTFSWILKCMVARYVFQPKWKTYLNNIICLN